jgi:hypothetical protein
MSVCSRVGMINCVHGNFSKTRISREQAKKKVQEDQSLQSSITSLTGDSIEVWGKFLALARKEDSEIWETSLQLSWRASITNACKEFHKRDGALLEAIDGLRKNKSALTKFALRGGNSEVQKAIEKGRGEEVQTSHFDYLRYVQSQGIAPFTNPKS